MSHAGVRADEPTIVGTSGHVDHGKTTLIRALTGIDLDTQPEEKARGITIALGFTNHTLPSGRVVSFVDVPGHESLVRTMVAGAAGMDAALVCVSAREGVMPQTIEHIAILGLLGVKQGIIALTMGDLCDEETRALALMDVHDAVQGTFLEHAPVVETSVRTDDHGAIVATTGIDSLRAALEALATSPHEDGRPFRLPIDRAFVRPGFGSIATGALRGGSLQNGINVQLAPGPTIARVRSLQVHGHAVDAAFPGQRVAVNLAGVDAEAVSRGLVLVAPGSIPRTTVLDVRLVWLRDAPVLERPMPVRFLLGTAEVMGVVDPLGQVLAPDGSAFAQVRLKGPVVALPHDAFVLRRESPVMTLGGGRVLDPWATPARRRGAPERLAALGDLARGDLTARLRQHGDRGLDDQRFHLLQGDPKQATALGDHWLDPATVDALLRVLIERLEAYHLRYPLRPGLPRAEAAGGRLHHLTTASLAGLIDLAVARGLVRAEGRHLRRSTFEVRLHPRERALATAMTERCRHAGLEGVAHAAFTDEEEPVLSHLLENGTLLLLADQVWLDDALQEMTTRLRAWLSTRSAITASEFKEHFGLSRKQAIPLLEWLDRTGVTDRKGDLRTLAPMGALSSRTPVV